MKLLGMVALLLSLCLAGCHTNQIREDTSRQINVFGIDLYSPVDYREIAGVKATEEPCLKGYERIFDPLEITIGYGLDKKIRKIATRNPGTSLFGIVPGASAIDGKRLAELAGLAEVSPYRYANTEISLTLLVDAESRVFGIILESLD